MGQKEEDTDERRNVKRKIEIEGQDVEKNDTERQNERGQGNCTKGIGENILEHEGARCESRSCATKGRDKLNL